MKIKSFSKKKNDINININMDLFKNSQDILYKMSNETFSNEKKNFNYINKSLLQSNNNQDEIDFNELTYYEAIEKDHRNVAKIFISLFNLKLECLQIAFYPKEFSHKSLTFSLYLFDLLLDLTINSLLFSDDVISQKYYNNGELRLLTTNVLSISSNIICNFILFVIGKLINYFTILEMIKKEVKHKKEFYQIFLKIFFLIELKIIIFFFVLFLIALFCIYYLFIFCAIYKKIQKTLFINYIIGSLWSLAFTVGICLIVTILRKIAMQKKIKRLYLISKFIDDKF